ncbi:MAG: 50S ribosomal protein L10 [Candidatus Neomarinimicrobiota bacterium]|nr:50S ribosomal protein L10 [Candidatus Neomarinimicrobiota bacterium]
MPNAKNIKKVDELTEKLERAKGVYLTDYIGLNVQDITDLRREFYENDVEYLVTKNTLLKIAANNSNLNKLDSVLNGSTAVAFSYEDPTSPARVIKKFTKDNELPKVKGIVIDGELIDGSEFDRIANLPTKEESIAKFAALLQSPLLKLIWALKSPMSDMTNMLNNLKEKESNKD